MFDVTSPASYRNVVTWHRDLTRVCPNIPIVFVGNKIYIRDCKVPVKRVTFHKKNNMRYFEISAKSNYHFEMPFLSIAHSILNDPNLQFISAPAYLPPEVQLVLETKSDGQCEMKRFKREALEETDIELSDDDESEEMIDQPRQASNIPLEAVPAILSNFAYIITLGGFEEAIELVQPVTAIENFADILNSDENMFSCACYALWGFCIANHGHTLSKDMKIKVSNFLNWANIVLSNKEVQSVFVDKGIVPYFPRTVNHFQIWEKSNYFEIADILGYFFPKD